MLGSVAGYVDYVEKEFNKLFQDVIQANPEIFDPNVFTLEAFLWVFGILRSRTFVPLTGNDLALVPFADLVISSSITSVGNSTVGYPTFCSKKKEPVCRCSIWTRTKCQLHIMFGRIGNDF